MTLKINPKTPIAIKICGITEASQAKDIAEMGANAIGVIGVAKSPRFVDPLKRDHIFAELEASYKSLERVLVVADLNDDQLDFYLNREVRPTIVQLHGNESKQRCIYLKNKYKQIQWWKALRIRRKDDLAKIKY